MRFASRLTFCSDGSDCSEASGPVLTLSIARATTFAQRMRGLLGHPPPPEGCALLIERCGSVHTIGMRFPLDLIFLDRRRRVTRVLSGIPPNRPFLYGGWRATSVLEAASGRLPVHLLLPGMAAVISDGEPKNGG